MSFHARVRERLPLRALLTLLTFCLGVLPSLDASADEKTPEPGAPAVFALIIGSNQSVDAELTPLKYADDDAARYFDLFRLLGARTYLLSRLDDNTRRLHPQAMAEAEEPRRAQLDRALAQLASDVTVASARNVQTLVYFVYAGHGNVKNGEGYLTLEDSRVSAGELAKLLRRLPADRIHVIADACASFYLAHSRGPGGERRPLEGFRSSALADDPRVGLLLSTSSARESHEWDAFQAGVFSHEVRSGLYGAADADGDGFVSYREIAAFVARANAAVPNDRYRPDVFARAPLSSGTLLDIRKGLNRKLIIDGKHSGHYILEDARGVRLADVHNSPDQDVGLLRPGASGPLYLRRLTDDMEFEVEVAAEVIALADLAPAERRSRSRGALHEAFSLLFTLPFDAIAAAQYRESQRPDATVEGETPAAPTGERHASIGNAPRAPIANNPGKTRRTLGIISLAVGGAGLGLGSYFAISSAALNIGSAYGKSNAAVAAKNDLISRTNTAAIASFVAGGALLVTGGVLLLWPRIRGVRAAALPGHGALVDYEISF